MTITIEDPSCQARIRYEIETSYGTAGLNLNNKQLVIPIESLLSIAVSHETDKNKIFEEWNRTRLRENKDRERTTQERLTKRIFNGIGTAVSFVGLSKEAFETAENIHRSNSGPSKRRQIAVFSKSE